MYFNPFPDMGPDSHLSNVHLSQFQNFFIPWADQDVIGWDWSIIMDHTRVAEILSLNFRIDLKQFETFRKYLIGGFVSVVIYCRITVWDKIQ